MVKLKVLVACETSGAVRNAFASLGAEAVSCDILDSEVQDCIFLESGGSGVHHKGDVKNILDSGFDLMIAHPPCTYLSVSGMHWTTRGFRDPKLTEDALEFAQVLFDSKIKYKCIENPVSILSTKIRKPNQIIQPWMFGHDASKSTCLWLDGLPCLQVTSASIIPPKGWEVVLPASEMQTCGTCEEPYCTKHNMHYSDCNCIGPSEDDVTFKKKSTILFGTKLNPAPRMLWANQTPTGQNKLGPSKDRWKERSKTYEGIATAMALQWTTYLSNLK